MADSRNIIWQNIKNKTFEYVYFDGRDKNKEALYKNQAGLMFGEFEAAFKNEKANNEAINKLIINFERKKEEFEQIEINLIPKNSHGNQKQTYNSNQNKIILWTDIFGFLNLTDRIVKNQLSPQDCFRTLISSREFIYNFRGEGQKYSRLSMTDFLRARDPNKKQIKEEEKEKARKLLLNGLKNAGLDSSRMNSATKAFYDAVKKSFEDYFREQGVQVIEEEMTKAWKEIRKVTTTITKKTKTTQIKQYNDLKDNLKRILKESAQEIIKKNNLDINDITDSIRISISNDDNKGAISFMEISLIDNGVKGVYGETKQKNKQLENENEYEYKLRLFKQAIQDTYNKMEKTNILNLDYAKNITVNSYFWETVQSFITNDLEYLCNKIFNENQKFFTQAWNLSSITGMLGELTVYLSSFSSNIQNLILAGQSMDIHSVTGDNMGESFRDLTFLIESVKYGVNVKRYLSVSGLESFNLYDDSEGISLASQYMGRYFSQEEIKLMRFIESNYDFIINKIREVNARYSTSITLEQIEDFYKKLSISNIDKFVRLTSAAVDGSNLFYVINNIVIPASVILDFIIETLKDSLKVKELFEIKREKKVEVEDYDVKVVENEYVSGFLPKKVMESKNIVAGSTRIIFKGLKLNNLGQMIK